MNSENLKPLITLLQKTFTTMLEIKRLTYEIEKALDSDDILSIDLMYDMREKEMFKSAELNEEIDEFMRHLSSEDYLKVNEIMKSNSFENSYQDNNFIRLNSLYTKIQSIGKECYDKDIVLLNRLKGKQKYI